MALREVDGITVGTGVNPVQSRLPMVLAQQALTVSIVSGGRLKLGVGMTHPLISERMWGIPWNRHVRRVNEYLDGLLPLLRGEQVRAAGELVTTRGGLQIQGAPQPPVYVAALGPQLLRVTGRRAAGTITWMTGPRTLASHVVPTLRAAAEETGRTAEVVAGVPVCVTEDRERAYGLMADALAAYGSQPSYRAMLDREGFDGPADAGLIGNEDEVQSKLDELAEIGVDELAAYVIAPAAEDAARTRALLARNLAPAGPWSSYGSVCSSARP